MNWAWAASLDQIWRSPSFPMWLTLSAAAFFGIIVFFMLLRTEQSVASGALAIITLLSLGIAVASILRGYEPAAQTASAESKSAPPIAHVLPALSCVDDLAGETVGQACERAVFASPVSTAAAVNYAASMITRVVSLGDAASAQRTMSSDMQATRRAIERDRYGLMAHVLLTRERCSPNQCAAYRSLTDNHQIITNMDEHAFDSLVAHYAPLWSAPQMTAAAGPLAMMPPSMPTGRPTNAEFPSSANTPPVSIMTPEPGTGTKLPAAAAAPTPAARAPAQTAAAPPAPAATAAKKPPAAKRAPAAPTPISPAAQAPAASED